MALPPNPLTQHQAQTLSWKNLEEKQVYNFELLIPFNGVVEPYKNLGSYLYYCAQAREAYLSINGFNAGEMLIIGIPVCTFERAYFALSYILRNQIIQRADTINVRIKFEKESRESMRIIECEMLIPTPEQIEFAKTNYSAKAQKVNEFKRKNRRE